MASGGLKLKPISENNQRFLQKHMADILYTFGSI